jgi:hypothetical protein
MLSTAGWRRTGIAVVAALTLVAGGSTAVAQVDPNIYVNLTSSQDKAADQKHGEDYHEGLRSLLENRMFNGIKKAYPCIHYLDGSAARQMLTVERWRELLGGQDESRLPAIATAVGATQFSNVSVTVMGDTVSIGGSMMDSASAKTIGRAQVIVPAGDTNAIMAAMDKFVAQLVASAGADGPKCGRWQGEIRATAAQHDKGKNPNGDPFTLDIDLTISCQIGKGDDNEVPCTLSYSSALVGKDASTRTTANGQARCNAGFGIYQGVAKISLGSCQIQGSTQISVAGQSANDKPNLSLGGWEVEVPVTAGTRNVSGSRQVDKATNLTWSLSWK